MSSDDTNNDSDNIIVFRPRRDPAFDRLIPEFPEAWRCQCCGYGMMLLFWTGEIICNYCGARQPPELVWSYTVPSPELEHLVCNYCGIADERILPEEARLPTGNSILDAILGRIADELEHFACGEYFCPTCLPSLTTEGGTA
jgi:hypothetical protein